MGLPEGKILTIDIVSQNRLNTIRNHEFLGVTPGGLCWRAFSNDTFISKIGLVVEKLLKINI